MGQRPRGSGSSSGSGRAARGRHSRGGPGRFHRSQARPPEPGPTSREVPAHLGGAPCSSGPESGEVGRKGREDWARAWGGHGLGARGPPSSFCLGLADLGAVRWGQVLGSDSGRAPCALLHWATPPGRSGGRKEGSRPLKQAPQVICGPSRPWPDPSGVNNERELRGYSIFSQLKKRDGEPR